MNDQPPKSQFSQELKNMKLHPVTLTYRDKYEHLEYPFRNYYISKSLRSIRIALLLAAFLIGIFGWLDNTLPTELRNELWMSRFAIIIPILLVTFSLSFWKGFIENYQPIASICTLLTGIFLVRITSHVPISYNLHYYIGLLFYILFGYTFLKLRFIWSLITISAVVILFEVTALLVLHVPVIQFWSYNFYVFTANIMGIFAAYFLERNARRNFLISHLLEKAHANAVDDNVELEQKILERTYELEKMNVNLLREIAERQKTEKTLNQQQQLMDEIFNNVQEGIGILDKDFKIVFHNPAFISILKNDKLKNQNLLQLIHLNQDSIKEKQVEYLPETTTRIYELPYTITNEKQQYLRIHITPRLNDESDMIGYYAMVQDITPQKNSETELVKYKQQLENMVDERTKELEKSNEKLYLEVNERILTEMKFRRFKAISDKANYGTAIIDSYGKFVYVNHYYAEILGYGHKELVRKYIWDFHSDDQKKLMIKTLEQLREDREISGVELYYQHKNGEKIPMLLTAKAIDKKPKENAFFAVTTIDISELKEKQEIIETQKKEVEAQRNLALQQRDEIELRNKELEKAFKKSSRQHVELQKALMHINEQNIELEAAYSEIKESNRMKEIFLANTSHEIRTPLNAILGLTNLLQSTPVNNRQSTYLENIETSGNTLLRIINDILDFSKIEAGKLELDEIDFDFRNDIQRLLDTLKLKATEKNIFLTSYIDPEIPEVLFGDSLRLNQILMNLLSNAIKFTGEKGSVKLNVQKNGYTKSPETDVTLKFEVIDTGIGIRKEKINTLFKSFTQAESHTTRLYGGTGLGLSIVKRLVELHDGDISVESKVGEGTTFTIIINYLIGHDSFTHESFEYNTQLGDCHPKNIAILLAEDNEINQDVVIDTIKEWNPGIFIDIAENGLEVMEKIKVNDYHLILMDIQMPTMDGFEACIKIRSELDFPKNKVPIIALTANALQEEKDKAYKAGMNDYISKPFEANELFFKIKTFTCKETQEALKNDNPIQLQKFKCKHHNKIVKKDIKRFKTKTSRNFKFIDLSYLSRIYKGKKSNINRIIEKYLKEVPSDLKQLRTYFETKNYSGIRASAHSLKPILNYLGLNEMHENAKKIEQNAQAKTNMESTRIMINEMEVIWEKAEQELLSFIK